MSGWVSLKKAADDKTPSTEQDILIEKYGFKKPVWKTKVGLFQTVNKLWSFFFVNWLKRPIGYICLNRPNCQFAILTYGLKNIMDKSVICQMAYGVKWSNGQMFK